MLCLFIVNFKFQYRSGNDDLPGKDNVLAYASPKVLDAKCPRRLV